MNSFPDADVSASLWAEREIGRLIANYSYLLDSGKFDEVAKLLKHATLEVPGATAVGEADIEKFLISGVQRHEDGTPRTWHAVSNILVDVDLEQGSATSKSYFTVHQELEGLPLQAICMGHYHDTFSTQNGSWHFVRRAVTAHLMGDLKFHVGGLSSDTAS